MDIEGTHRIEVTAEDIAHGVREDCERCPISRALTRALPIRSVIVEGGVQGVAVQEKGTFYRFFATLPEDADAFVERFDRGEDVAPFAFDLRFQPEEP